MARSGSTSQAAQTWREHPSVGSVRLRWNEQEDSRVTLARRAETMTMLALAAIAIVALSAVSAVAATNARVPSALAPGVDARTRAAHDLVAFVPAEFRSTCTIPHPREPTDGSNVTQAMLDTITVELVCRPGNGVDTVIYTQHDSVDNADLDIDALIDTKALDRESGDSGDCPSSSTYSLGKSHRRAGRVYCFLASADNANSLPPGTPVITWTYEPLAIVAQTWGSSLDPEPLHSFYANDAGPLSTPDRSGIPPLATAAALRSAGNALSAIIPKPSRTGCQIRDSLAEGVLGSLYPYRLWITADVEECTPDHGSQESEYVRFSDTQSMNRYFDDYGVSSDPGGDERVTAEGIHCSGLGSYNTGNKKAGRVACNFAYFDPNAQPSATEYANILWTSIPTRVVASGFAPATQVRDLIQWWREDSGPIVK
jgi:hypothetical protein